MKKQCILLSLFLFLLVINIPFVIATSETISLTPDLWQSITRNVELQMNDRLVGSFTVSNLQIWQNGLGQNQTLSVSVKVLDPNGQIVLSYSNTKGDSFDYTAFYSGVYTIEIGCGYEYFPPSGIPNPQITLNYSVVSSTASLKPIGAISETFSLSPMTTIVRNVELQSNDRLVGSFTVSNLQIWQNGFGDNQTHSVSVTVLDPKGQVVLSYASTAGDSFDYTAFYSGVYTIQFTCGFEYSPPSGIENPEITLNYNVVSAVQQTPTAQIQTPTPYQPESPNQFQTQTQQPNLLSSGTSMNPRILVVIVAAVIICIGVAVIAILTKTGRLNSRGKQVEVLQR
jgi:hypothetical protein